MTVTFHLPPLRARGDHLGPSIDTDWQDTALIRRPGPPARRDSARSTSSSISISTATSATSSLRLPSLRSLALLPDVAGPLTVPTPASRGVKLHLQTQLGAAHPLQQRTAPALHSNLPFIACGSSASIGHSTLPNPFRDGQNSSLLATSRGYDQLFTSSDGMPLGDAPRSPGRNSISNPFRPDHDWSRQSAQIPSSPETMHSMSQGGRGIPGMSFSYTPSPASPFDSPDSHPRNRLPLLSSLTDPAFARHGLSGALTSNRPNHAFDDSTRQSSPACEEAARDFSSQAADRRPSFGRPHSHSAPMPYPKVESLFSVGRRANTGTDDALSQSTTSSRSRSFSASDVAGSALEERTLTAPKVRESTQAKIPDVPNPKMYACTGCDKTFARRYDRNRHARKHTGEKPYSCANPQCEADFVRPDALQRHYKAYPACESTRTGGRKASSGDQLEVALFAA